jgi:hypothetical protein
MIIPIIPQHGSRQQQLFERFIHLNAMRQVGRLQFGGEVMSAGDSTSSRNFRMAIASRKTLNAPHICQLHNMTIRQLSIVGIER